jgi:GDP-4-dehydro-6-deoxy-D-mannose reductase
MRTLITGVNGFVGGHLATMLLDGGSSVIGTGRSGPTGSTNELVQRGLDFQSNLLDDTNHVTALLDVAMPDTIVHLASTRVGSAPDVVRTNVLGTACVIDAVVQSRRPIRVVIVGSSAMYGDATDRVAQSEKAPRRPMTAYGSSKACADLLAEQSFRSTGVSVMRATPFNIIGPGQRGDYFTANCAKQLVAIERSRQPATVKLGSLEAFRDFTDVRDLARALVAILERGEPGENYNVCSGTATSIKNAVDAMCRISGTQPTIESAASSSSSDVPFQLGSSAKLQSRTNWRPEITLDQTLADILDDWRVAL